MKGLQTHLTAYNFTSLEVYSFRYIKQRPQGPTLVGMSTGGFLVTYPHQEDIYSFFSILKHIFTVKDLSKSKQCLC